MNLSANKILNEMRSGLYHPVYVLQGEESYYIDFITQYAEEHALEVSQRDFNQIVLYGRETSVATLMYHARRLPVMSDRQLIVVRDAQEMSDLQRSDGIAMMLRYLHKPVLSTILLLCYRHKTVDKRKELGKKLDKLTVSVVFNKIYDRQISEFIRTYVHNKKCKIEEQGVAVLSEYVGNDLKRLTSEIDKMLVNVGESRNITVDQVVWQVGISREYNVFALQKALARKDRVNIYKVLYHFIEKPKKNPAIPIVGFLYSFYSKLLVASMTKETSEIATAKVLGLSTYAIKDYMLALRHYLPSQIILAIQFISQADMQLKGLQVGTKTEGEILKELVSQIIR